MGDHFPATCLALNIRIGIFSSVFISIAEASMTKSMTQSMTCSPATQSVTEDTDVTFVCTLQNVPRIIETRIACGQFDHQYFSEGGLSGIFRNNSISVTVDLEAENQITHTLVPVTCGLEGEVIITVNGNLSDTVSLVSRFNVY